MLVAVDGLAGQGTAARVPLVEITGGEPLLQPETPALAEKLLAAGYTVMIETSGERFVGVFAAGGDQDCGREMPRFGRSGYL